MRQLVELIDEHPDAIAYDLLQCGERLRDFPDGGVSWHDIAVLVRQAQPQSAIYKAMNPHWQRTPELELLRLSEWNQRVLIWQKTEDGRRGRNVPEPVPMPWDPEPEPLWQADTFEWDDAAEAFGDPRLAAILAAV